MRRVVAVLSGVLLLAGCASPALPPGPTPEQVITMQEQQARDSWTSQFPDEPMPVVHVVAYATAETQAEMIGGCVEANVPADADFDIEFTGDAWTFSGQFAIDKFVRLQWLCTAEHPLDPAGEHGLLSYEQLEYAYAYLTQRSMPCLVEGDYSTSSVPDWEHFANPEQGLATWSPYYWILDGQSVITGMAKPSELSVARLAAAVLECPPPPIGDGWVPELDD